MAGNPSSWVNLQDYLGLNQDQGAQMASDVYQQTEDKAEKAGTQLNSDVNNYNHAVASGTPKGPNADGSAAQYTGPTDLASYDPSLEGNVSDAIQKMQQTADPNQRGYVLQETYGSRAGQSVGDNAFDSFLMNGGPGGAQLDTFGQKYKDLQNALGLDEQNAYDSAQKAIATSATSGQPAAAKTPDTSSSWHPGDYQTLQQFMDQGSASQYAHEVAMDASPVDWLTRGLGELGYNGENASQLFAGKFGANGNSDLSWNIGNLRSAARLVQAQYGDDALSSWFKSLTPDTWKQYMDLGNAGAQARVMRAWLESNGHHKK
jgi:hypothetical protein